MIYKAASKRHGTHFHGSIELPEGARVLSLAVGHYEDKSVYCLIASDRGPYITHNGKTRKLEPIV